MEVELTDPGFRALRAAFRGGEWLARRYHNVSATEAEVRADFEAKRLRSGVPGRILDATVRGGLYALRKERELMRAFRL